MKQTEQYIPSPCVSICALNDQNICTGCQRSIDEITRWAEMDNHEKKMVIQCCLQRARDEGLVLD